MLRFSCCCEADPDLSCQPGAARTVSSLNLAFPWKLAWAFSILTVCFMALKEVDLSGDGPPGELSCLSGDPDGRRGFRVRGLTCSSSSGLDNRIGENCARVLSISSSLAFISNWLLRRSFGSSSSYETEMSPKPRSRSSKTCPPLF